MKTLSFNEFLNESQTMSSKEICDYITSITPDESDVPDYFFDLIKKSNKQFVLKNVKIQDLLDSDPSLKEYVEAGEDRYGDSREDTVHEPEEDDIDNPIVVFNGEVMDGYNRTLVHVLRGEEYINAYTT